MAHITDTARDRDGDSTQSPGDSIDPAGPAPDVAPDHPTRSRRRWLVGIGAAIAVIVVGAVVTLRVAFGGPAPDPLALPPPTAGRATVGGGRLEDAPRV